MWKRIKNAWKAVVAGATPIVTGLVADWISDLETALPGLIAGALSTFLTYMVRNEPLE